MQSGSVIQECPDFYDGTKVSIEHKISLWRLLVVDPTAPSRIIFARAVSVTITIRQLNRLRINWGLNRPKGRPQKLKAEAKPDCLPVPVTLDYNITFIGVHLFACWVELQQSFALTMVLLRHAIDTYNANNPEDFFPLLRHRNETLECRFKAILFAPLFGIGKLIEYDVKEHALKTLICRGYQSSTLNQFLGQLERIDAASTLMGALIPDKSNGICYIDGHMIAFWSRLSMHKGKITMLGRIMAGSQAVIAHSEDGRAIFVEYYPPDMRLPQTILDYCEKIVSLTGIDLFVIDREINSVAMACAFKEKGWGLLSMLDQNEYKDLSDWNVECIGVLDGGAKVHKGSWRDEKKKDDPRKFVIVERDGKLLPFWGTPKFAEVVDYIEWPGMYSQRNGIQENSFKRMKAYGALDVNFGTKKIITEDRHQQRAIESLEEKKKAVDEKIVKKTEKIEAQEEKVKESKENGHEKRLEQRQGTLIKLNEELENTKARLKEIEQGIEKLGPPKTRRDRDFRKQGIMTFRTLLIENLLMAFISTLRELSSIELGADSIMELLFRRSGAMFETSSKIVYLVNVDGLSKQKRIVMLQLLDAMNKMGIKHDCKLVYVRPRSRPDPS